MDAAAYSKLLDAEQAVCDADEGVRLIVAELLADGVATAVLRDQSALALARIAYRAGYEDGLKVAAEDLLQRAA